MGSDRLGTVFHESFSLSRQSINRILKAIFENPKIATVGQAEREIIFRDTTTLGTRQVKSTARYARGIGAIDPKNLLSPFGEYILRHDPLMDQMGTQWLMHYHLSAPHGPGPAFWNELVLTRFRPGDDFTRNDIIEQIAEFYKQNEGKSISIEDSVKPTAAVFLSTYTKSEAMGGLGLLEETAKDHYHVVEPIPPSVWVLALALLDYWQANFQDRVAINLGDLYNERSLASLFMVGSGRINAMLFEMQNDGYVEIYRISPPYTVALLKQDVNYLLKRLYGADPAL